LLFAYKVDREVEFSAIDKALAANSSDLRRKLEARGYLVLNITEKKAGLRGGRGNTRDFHIFSQKFIPLVKAGVPILQSLEINQKRP
jgi:type II secretory pathway component PulF